MNKAVSLLLSNAYNKDLSSTELEIIRLSEQFGQPFLITINPIDILLLDSYNSEEDRMYKALELSLLDFVNEELYKSRGVECFKDLIDELFILGEIHYIYTNILDISVLSKDDVESFKEDRGYDDAYWLWKHKYITKPSEYFDMSFADKQVITLFINKKMEESNIELKELMDSVKDSKSAEAMQGQLLIKLVQLELY